MFADETGVKSSLLEIMISLPRGICIGGTGLAGWGTWDICGGWIPVRIGRGDELAWGWAAGIAPPRFTNDPKPPLPFPMAASPERYENLD